MTSNTKDGYIETSQKSFEQLVKTISALLKTTNDIKERLNTVTEENESLRRELTSLKRERKKGKKRKKDRYITKDMGKNFEKFLLLLWKNVLLHVRHPTLALFELLAPCCVCFVLVYLRYIVGLKSYKAIFYPSFDPLEGINSQSLKGIKTILYSPINPNVATIMDKTASKLKLKAEGMPSGQAMELLFHNDEKWNEILGGVQFEDSLSGNIDLPKNLHVAIRLPAELRKPPGDLTVVGNSWQTNALFPPIRNRGPRAYKLNETAPPEYFDEGFLAIQLALSQSILEHFGVSDIDSTTIKMQRFPHPDWKSDPMLEIMDIIGTQLIVFGFMVVSNNITKSVTVEKETQIKEVMKIMGLSSWLHWTAWFFKYFIFMTVTTVLMVIILSTPLPDFAVFHYADPMVIFVFFVTFISSVITLSFMATVFFKKSSTASAFGGVLYMLTFFPFLFIAMGSKKKISYTTTILLSLLSNSALGFGFRVIGEYEKIQVGVQWNNIWRTPSSEDNITLGTVMVMLVVDTLLYMLITLYVDAVFPGEYGIPRPWYFLCTSTFWCRQKAYTDEEDLYEEVQFDKKNFEKEPTNLFAGIQIRKLRKKFGSKVVVRDISLNMYEDQITVLLGHNGAGKTTTVSMLIGLIEPSSGTAYVGGYNIRTQMTNARESLGICPQYNVLFDDLTVEEHIYFFSKLKGVKRTEVKAEIQKYVELLDLGPKRKARSSTLSGGMKRKLSVGMALCGNSKVILLDEPTAGMDPTTRRVLWDLLLKCKKGRTMLLTTHYMDEADLLGDRIAIMAGGQLQCCGSSFFLKKRYGAGYLLIMDKSDRCVPSAVTQLLRKYIPGVEEKSNIGSELTYVLSENYLSNFEDMLRDLEANTSSLGIRNYGISLTTLEEVFMKVGADHGVEEEKGASEGGKASKGLGDTKIQIGEEKRTTGCSLWKNQVFSMLYKKTVCTFRDWLLLLLHLILPIAIISLALIFSRIAKEDINLPEFELSLDPYDKPVTIVTGTGEYKKGYVGILMNEDRLYEDIGSSDITDHIIQKIIENAHITPEHYILGTTFEEQSINALFNNEPYHSPPLALSMAVNSVVRATLGSGHNIRITNYPFPFTVESRLKQMDEIHNVGNILPMTLGSAMVCLSSYFVVFYIRERATNAKHLQLVSGVDVFTFWGVAFIFDQLIFLIISLCIVLVLAAFQIDGYKTLEENGRLLLLLILYGYAILPLTYLLSFIWTLPATGYSSVMSLNLFLGVFPLFAIMFAHSLSSNAKALTDKLNFIFLIYPLYNLCSAIKNIYTSFSVQEMCKNTVELCVKNIPSYDWAQCQDFACNYTPDCCDTEVNYFAWEIPGIGMNIVYFLSVGTILMLILLTAEYGILKRIFYLIRFTAFSPSVPPDEDVDVAEERRKIGGINKATMDQYTLVLRDVTKYYGKFLAVNGLCLGLKNYECFGLLGVNGAGKTTTFKMLTGDVVISYGNVWVKGMNLKRKLKKVHKVIGYCPQFDALLDDLTGYETLLIFCLLRGVCYGDSKKVAVQLAQELDFYRHLHKRVKSYSGGNKRKLSTAIALIGNPPILYLDEPTAGMDPATRRQLWNVLCKYRDNGTCIILTSHNMEECEALCTRLAIMVNGNFKCLGSVQRLKSKFSEGYSLTIKVKKKTDKEALEADVLAVKNFVSKSFPGAELKEEHEEMITYFVRQKTANWSKMFGIMEGSKKRLNIEDYSMGQGTLEQVFLSFTKKQKEITT